jgi:hypothetical protein
MDGKETKPGVKTTEFWVAIAPVLMGMMETMKGDSKNSALIIICGTCLAAMYMVSRTMVKYVSAKKNSGRASKA